MSTSSNASLDSRSMISPSQPWWGIGALPFLQVRYSMLVKIADSHKAWSKKTYTNAVSVLRRAFAFGYRDHPYRSNPAWALKGARVKRKDLPRIDPFRIQDAEELIAAMHRDCGEAQGNFHEFRFFTGLRPSEEIALTVRDFDEARGTLSVTKARVLGIDKDTTKTREDRIIHPIQRADCHGREPQWRSLALDLSLDAGRSRLKCLRETL
jgi:integrase